MANVFLSYDREDTSRARRIAEALAKAGHSVWWDRHIKSGAQYSREIDQALKRADAVVVLWSAKSIESAWVRDEAATGRDSGKLVPALVDPVDPPLGFRQYQTTDLTSWKGRRNWPRFQELLEAIEALSNGEAADCAPAPPVTTRRAQARLLVLAAIGAVVLIAAGLLAWNLIGRSSSVPTVVVAPADGSRESDALARDLLVKLGTLQTARANSIDLVSNNDLSREPALTIQVGRSGQSQAAEANLSLTGKDRALLWAKDFRDPNGNEADLRQQLAYTAARVLDCALEGLQPLGRRLGREALKTYLNACSTEGSSGEVAALISPLRELVRQAPAFAGGWAELLLSEVAVMSDPRRPDRSDLRAAVARDIVEARKIHPDLAEAYLAEIVLTPEPQFLKIYRLLDRAIERNPDNAELRRTRAMFLGSMGRTDDALADASRAAELDPLSPERRDDYIATLAFAGRMAEARAELREAERLWPGATSVVDARLRLHLRLGDPREALRLIHAGALEGSPAHWIRLNEALLGARIDRSPQKIERAIQEAKMAYKRDPRAINGLLQTLVEFNREEELFQILLNWRRMDIVGEVTAAIFRPAFGNFHKDPRFMRVAKRLGLLDFWRTTDRWPDLCFRADLPYDCKAEATKLTA